MDLNNAFGEVHHSLIKFALEYHHIPTETINLIMNQYSENFVTVSNSKAEISTGSIPVCWGVLQGDTLSPLLFNLGFDTLMSTLNRPEIQSRCVLWGDGVTRSLWSQFADDAAIVCDAAKDTQLLINLFQRWTTWADLIIRPDKCFAYAASKRNGIYQQILPSFSVNGVPISPIKIGESMTYLGHQFSFSTDAEIAQSILLADTLQAIEHVKHLPITPLLKCHALNLQLRAKLSFSLSHCSLSLTWIKNNLNNIITGKIREWLDQPPCATAHYFSLPLKELGLDLTLPSLLYEQCQATSMAILANSKDAKMNKLSQNTNLQFVSNMQLAHRSKKTNYA